jgi:hypothetical protein
MKLVVKRTSRGLHQVRVFPSTTTSNFWWVLGSKEEWSGDPRGRSKDQNMESASDQWYVWSRGNLFSTLSPFVPIVFMKFSTNLSQSCFNQNHSTSLFLNLKLLSYSLEKTTILGSLVAKTLEGILSYKLSRISRASLLSSHCFNQVVNIDRPDIIFSRTRNRPYLFFIDELKLPFLSCPERGIVCFFNLKLVCDAILVCFLGFNWIRLTEWYIQIPDQA